MPENKHYRYELLRILDEAEREARKHIDVNAGEIHKGLGGYPSRDHRVPVCCDVMKAAMVPAWETKVLHEAPSDFGGKPDNTLHSSACDSSRILVPEVLIAMFAKEGTTANLVLGTHVSVPVLSKITMSKLRARSSASLSLTRRPFWARVMSRLKSRVESRVPVRAGKQ